MMIMVVIKKYFKFRVGDDDINRSFAHCVLCLESGQKKRGTISIVVVPQISQTT